jgi:hypothetical protein
MIILRKRKSRDRFGSVLEREREDLIRAVSSEKREHWVVLFVECVFRKFCERFDVYAYVVLAGFPRGGVVNV